MRHFDSVDTTNYRRFIALTSLFSSKFLVLYFRLVTMPVRWPLPPFSDSFQKMLACANLNVQKREKRRWIDGGRRTGTGTYLSM
jgi:hypothetical protein